MTTRIAVNVSQVYMPFYLQESLNLMNRPTVIAEVPLLVMITSFATAFCLRKMSVLLGRQSTFLFGSILVFGSVCGLFFLPASKWYLVFIGAFVLGIGTTIVQITAYNFEADLVGVRFESGAFVYGSLSFADKLANGLAIVLTSKYSKNAVLVRYIFYILPGGATLVALLTTYTVVEYYRKDFRKANKQREEEQRKRASSLFDEKNNYNSNDIPEEDRPLLGDSNNSNNTKIINDDPNT